MLKEYSKGKSFLNKRNLLDYSEKLWVQFNDQIQQFYLLTPDIESQSEKQPIQRKVHIE